MVQAHGPATAKVLSPSVERRVAGTVKSAEEAERNTVNKSTLFVAVVIILGRIQDLEGDGRETKVPHWDAGPKPRQVD